MWLWFHRVWLTVPALLVLWIYAAGSYSYWHDLLAILTATALTFLVFAPPPRLTSFHLAPSRRWFQTAWLLLSWTLVSMADFVSEGCALPKNGHVVAPEKMPDAWKDIRVGLALSGGGYRAALVHVGVMEELAILGVPVTHLSTVSGGSIIGACPTSTLVRLN
ncbi:MAG: hypothetical protein R3D51_17375 [Hyphomicrobiaceae bacterium]